MNPETLLWQLYRTNRICLRDLMSPDPEVFISLYRRAKISLPELLAFRDGNAKAKKKKRVRKRVKTDDKQAGAAQ